MRILLTNDDGIHAPGLWALRAAFAAHGEVTVVAPDRERSAVGHGITLHTPLRSTEMVVNGGHRGIAVNGKPADCVKLALHELMAPKPDLVVSGINPGANVGINLNYSGTVAAAKEAALFGIPALAVSIAGPPSGRMEEVGRFVYRVAVELLDNPLPLGTFLNLNFPDLPIAAAAGVKVSRQAVSGERDHFVKRTDPRLRAYYWAGAYNGGDADGNEEIDTAALAKDYISITPVKCDMTDHSVLDTLRSWGLENGFRDTFRQAASTEGDS
ncbi:MAG: 5'/3'-nucleotidase SurE [Desulfosarcinaceae bacterium]|jgi:5'-nucleotidase